MSLQYYGRTTKQQGGNYNTAGEFWLPLNRNYKPYLRIVVERKNL
ncbi:hypothetical protein [Pontibacter fetidus]|nr:hypothetical protein [Pontibacter fetidus]